MRSLSQPSPAARSVGSTPCGAIASSRRLVLLPRAYLQPGARTGGTPLVKVPDVFTAQGCLKKSAKLAPYTYTPPPLGVNDIDIQVTANGLCHTDIHMVDDDWGVSGFPFVPGHEVVGIVAAKGSNVTGLNVGDRVGYAWIKGSCSTCQQCRRGHEELCAKGYTGLITAGGNGGWGNFMRAPAGFAYRIPDALDDVSAAPLLCAGITVYAPLKRLITHPGMKVGVVGIGGLGHLALQFANAMGAEVTAFSTSPDKEADARRFGAHHFECSKDLSHLKGSLDVLLNTVSSKNDYTSQMALLGTDGTLCIVGLPVDDIKVSVLDVVFNGKKVIGSIVGGRYDMQEMLDFAALKNIKPMCEVMPLSKVNEACERVRANKARFRIVLTPDA